MYIAINISHPDSKGVFYSDIDFTILRTDISNSRTKPAGLISSPIYMQTPGIYKSFKDLQWPDEMVSNGDGSILSAKPSQKL